MTGEETFRNHLRVLLQGKEFNVSAFSNNRDAINYITRKRVDLILVDNSAEINSGIKFLKDLNRISKDYKVIILDKGGGIDLYLEAKKLGAVEYVFRPFKTYELMGIISKVLNTKDT
ncbi:MAG: response regulator [Nitrospinae bacterium]|nr:response regulator [Nitrospinota bacterium]